MSMVLMTQPCQGDGAGADASSLKSVDASGRVLVGTRVRGHVRMQAYGPGRAERRLIYVAEFSARRWCAPERRTVVGA